MGSLLSVSRLLMLSSVKVIRINLPRSTVITEFWTRSLSRRANSTSLCSQSEHRQQKPYLHLARAWIHQRCVPPPFLIIDRTREKTGVDRITQHAEKIFMCSLSETRELEVGCQALISLPADSIIQFVLGNQATLYKLIF